MDTTAMKPDQRETRSLPPGGVFGRYRLQRRLGEGGMGTVYEAVHAELGKRVAIKVLHGEMAADSEAHARFLREGEAAARVRHPHVVDVSDVDWHQGVPFLVMEYLEGEDLAALLEREGKLTVERTVQILLPVIAGVAAAHDGGVIHRDLKPQNIFLARTANGAITPKVLDFGVSRLLDGQGHSISLTRAGAVFGSAPYMSPEQARAERDVSAASDQYALGAVLYRCLTGRPAFPGERTFDVLRRVVLGQFPPPRQLCPELPIALEAVILRAMSASPSARFPHLHDLGRALLPFASPPARPRIRALLVLSLVASWLLPGPPGRIDRPRRLAAATTVGCGAERPDISSIRNVAGLAVDRQGTIYFSQSDPPDGWIGRLRPGGTPVERRWARVPRGSEITALAVDSNRRALYLASASASALQVIDLAADPPRLRDLVTGLPRPGGLALDGAGNLYCSLGTERRIVRVTPAGDASPVTGETMMNFRDEPLRPTALAIHPAGDLLVGSNLGLLLRLRLEGGREVSRTRFTELCAIAGGLAFDALGRLYVAEFWPGQRSVFRVEADGSRWSVVGAGTRLGSIAFGRGALDCRDLYVASADGPLQRLHLNAPGEPRP